MQELTIAVVGAGTAGLAAALGLARAGFAVTLFERFDTPRPVGAGLLLQPTGLSCLAQLDLLTQAQALGQVIDRIDGQTIDGQVVFDFNYRDLGTHHWGLGLHRGSLFELLYAALQQTTVTLVTQCTIEQAPLVQGGRLVMDSERQVYGPFDLVVDASGMGSQLRCVLGQPKRDQTYAYGALWGVCDDKMSCFFDKGLQQRYAQAKIMMGVLPIGKMPNCMQQQLAVFWSIPLSAVDVWRTQGLAGFYQQVQDLWPQTLPLVEQFQSTDDLVLAKYHDIILQRLYGEHWVALGDAAHCTSPQLGQGANLALLDARLLCACLQQQSSLCAALQIYQRQRGPQLDFYQRASRWLTPFFQSDHRLASWIRDRSFHRLAKIPFVYQQMLQLVAGYKVSLCSSDFIN